MKWYIEFSNGKILTEDNDLFDFSSKSKINKVYFSDGKNQCGFFIHSGLFFINNLIYDLKIKLDNFLLIPFQNKTASLILNLNKSSIVSWNIGYKLISDDIDHEYKMSIFPNKTVFLYASLFNNQKELINYRELKLQ